MDVPTYKNLNKVEHYYRCCYELHLFNLYRSNTMLDKKKRENRRMPYNIKTANQL